MRALIYDIITAGFDHVRSESRHHTFSRCCRRLCPVILVLRVARTGHGSPVRTHHAWAHVSTAARSHHSQCYGVLNFPRSDSVSTVVVCLSVCPCAGMSVCLQLAAEDKSKFIYIYIEFTWIFFWMTHSECLPGYSWLAGGWSDQCYSCWFHVCSS